MDEPDDRQRIAQERVRPYRQDGQRLLAWYKLPKVTLSRTQTAIVGGPESGRYLFPSSDHFANFDRFLEVIESMGFDPPLGSFHEEVRVKS